MRIPIPEDIIEPVVFKPYIPFSHTHSMTGVEFKKYKTPVVYAWKRGSEWLYVGYSNRGMQRVLDSKHHVMHKSEVEDNDKIVMMYNLNDQQARTVEADLIRRHKPKYNKMR